MTRISLPYEKRKPSLVAFRITSRKEPQNDPLGGSVEHLIYFLEEKRNSEWKAVTSLNVNMSDLWGGELKKILANIEDYLNDSSSYKWTETKLPITDFWRQRQKQEIERDLEAGGKGQWTIMSDHTLDELMKFIASIYGTKWEILRKLPSELPEWMSSKDAFENQVTSMAFDEVIVRDKIAKILETTPDDDEKARNIVQLIVNHSLKSSFAESLLNPVHYQDKVIFLSSDEELEIAALWELFENFKNDIEGDRNLIPEEKRIKMHYFWQKETGKRLNELNNRCVYGGTLKFGEKEESKRAIAYEIADRLFRILLTWGLSFGAAQTGKKEYFRLYSKEAWRRELREINFQNRIQQADSELKMFTEIMRSEWDSNSLTFLGVIIAIALAVFFGVFSLIPDIKWWGKILISVGCATLGLVLLVTGFKFERLRKPLLRWSRQILQVPTKK